MSSQRGFAARRAPGRRWVALALVGAVASLGADRPESWRDAGASLPPVALAPDTPLAPTPPDTTPVVRVAKYDPVPSTPVIPVSPPPAPIPAAMPARPEISPAPSARPAPPVAAAPAAPVAETVLSGAPAARVYVINGVSLFGPSGFSGMVDRIRAAGYSDTRSSPWYLSYRVERDIRQLHREQPGTPVAIIGYSFGTYRAKAIANRLTRDGIPVAMVGYVGGDYLRNSQSDVPGGAHVVNVTGNGFLLSGRNLFFRGTDLTGADNRRLDVRHLNLPRQQETVDSLLNGMAAATSGVPSAGAVAASPPAVVGFPPSTAPAAIAGTPNVLTPPRVDTSRPRPAPPASTPVGGY